MRTVLICVAVCVLAVLAGWATTEQAAKKGEIRQYVDTDTGPWLIHDMNRPAPAVISPGTTSTALRAGTAPTDAVVLFDGEDLSEWTDSKGGRTKWIMGDGYMECVKGSGYIQSKRKFGSCQLHVEFATPLNGQGEQPGTWQQRGVFDGRIRDPGS